LETDNLKPEAPFFQRELPPFHQEWPFFRRKSIQFQQEK